MKYTLSLLGALIWLVVAAASQDADQMNDHSADEITDMTKQNAGLFIWYELNTNDKDAAIEFYTKVIGWGTQTSPMPGVPGDVYTMFAASDSAIAGVMQLDPRTMGDAPPHWVTYISVDDVDASLEKARGLGASVIVEAFDVPTVGRMALLNDPQGAVFAIYRPEETVADKPWPPSLHTFSWNELVTTDYQAAFNFYNELFGWEQIDSFDMGNGWMYLIYGHGDRMYGGMYDKPADQPGPPAWLFYINVNDIDEAVERVRANGGQVISGPMEVPGGDKVAQCLDPQGAFFALQQYPASTE